MSVVFPLHILATIVLLGGLFFASVLFQPIVRGLDIETAASLWQQMLSRFFAWGWVSLLLILATGISMVFLKFGGFAGVPMIIEEIWRWGCRQSPCLAMSFSAHGIGIAARCRAVTGPPHRRKSHESEW